MNRRQPNPAKFPLRDLLWIGLAVLFLAPDTRAAGSTAGIDLRIFSVDSSLNKFWLYVDSTINTGTGFTSASHGKVGSGDYITGNSNTDSFKTTTIVRGNLNGSGPSWVFDSSLYVQGNATLRSAKFRDPRSIVQVVGDLTYSANGGVDSSSIWVGGNATFMDNNTRIFNKVHVGKNITLSGLNTNPNALKNVFRDTIYHTNLADAATIATLTTNPVPTVNQAYVAPQAPPTFYTSANMPGYGLAFTLPATPENVDGRTYETTLCPTLASGCANYPGLTGAKPLPAGKVLPPGYYGSLTLYSGNQVVLGEGVYYFDNVELRNTGAKLVAYQPNGGRTIVYAKNGFNTLSGGIYVGPDSGYIASKFGVTSSSDDFSGGTMMIVAGTNASIRIDSDASMWATLSAPTGTINANSQFKLYGQMFARHFKSVNRFSGAEGEFIPFYPDPPKITVSKFDAVVSEGDVTSGRPDTTIAKFVISMDHINGQAVVVWYHTVDSTAVSSGTWTTGSGEPDFVPVSKAGKTYMVIPPAMLSDTIRIKVVGDKATEGTEYFKIVLDSSFNGTLGTSHADSVGLGTILDNDTLPTIRISDIAAYEGNSGSKDFVFVVSLFHPGDTGAYSGSVKSPIGYKWKTLDGTALVSDNDYVDSNWTSRTIPPGTSTDTIRVRVLGDLVYEKNETFKVLIDSASVTGPVVVDNNAKKLVGIGTIRNDDSIPAITINDSIVDEGQRVALRASFKTASKSGDSACFDWKTLPTGTPDSATAGKDYLADSGHACIPAGSNSVTLRSIATLTDNIYEANERFFVKLTPTFGLATVPDRVGIVTIRNTNPKPTIRIDDVTGKRSASGPTTFVFKVHLIDATTGLPTSTGVASSFSWKTLRGSALPGSDYDSAGGVFQFSGTDPADSVKTISVIIRGSSQFYATGLQFTVALTMADANIDTGLARTKTVGVGTILSAVGAPILHWTADTVDEGSRGTRNAIHFRLVLRDSLGNLTTSRDPVVFVWRTQDGTAKSALPDTHYVARSRVVATIPANASGITDTVAVIGNDLFQDNLRILYGVIDHSDAAASGYNKILSDFRTPGGIRDADIAPILQNVIGTAILEGNVGQKRFPFVVRLDRPSGLPVVYSWKTLATGTASPGTDFVAIVAATDTIAAGAVADTVYVSVNGDLVLEADETLVVEATPISGLRATTPVVGVDTILNDDDKPVLAVRAASIDEGSPSGLLNQLRFVVAMLDSSGRLLNNPPALPIGYSWTTQNGTGDSAAYSVGTDTDFVAGSGTRSFPSGRLLDTIVVPIRADLKYEYDEWMTLVLTTASNALLTGPFAVPSARGTIRNDDSRPTLVIDDPSVTEPVFPTSPDSSLRYVLRLSAPAGVPVTVHARTNDSTAVSPSDYQVIPDSLITFPAGDTVATIPVKVHGDTIYEGTEVLKLVLSNGNNNAVITKNTGVGTILDQDQSPILHVDSATAIEGAAATFRISVSNLSSLPVIFRWTTTGLTATAGLDYREQVPIFDTIEPLTRAVQVTVPTYSDTLANEGIEAFRLLLSNPVNATVGNTGLGSIIDITPKPKVSIDSVMAPESVGNLVFHVHLDRASAVPFTLRWNTTDDSDKVLRLRARPSGLDSNYAPRSNADLVLRSGLTDTTLSVAINDNNVDDPDSLYFKVLLAAKTGSDDTAFNFADSIGVGTLIDNDLPPTISIRDSSVREPLDAASPAVNMVFTIAISARSVQPITVGWSTSDNTAKHDSDYTTKSGTATIPAGSTTATVAVPILADSLWEGSETFRILLRAPINATLNDSVGLGTILDNDTAPAVRIGDALVIEPDTLPDGSMDSVQVIFKASLSHRSGLPVVFKWRTADSTAFDTAGDYRAVAATSVTIPAGDSVAYLKVWILSDGISELTEYFKVPLSKSTPGDPDFTFADSSGVGTIKNSNGRPRLSINDSSSLVEANANLPFYLRLSNKSSTPIRVYLHTADQGTTAGKDYRRIDTVLTIPAFQVLDTLTVRIFDDLLHENTEYFRLIIDSTDSLIDPGDPGNHLPGANISGLGFGSGKIIDNDSAPGITISNSSRLEPARLGDTATSTFTVRLTSPSGLPVSVRWTTVDSTAQTKVPFFDYVSEGGSVSFAPGDSVRTISVKILGDSLYEGPETYRVVLSEPTGGTIDTKFGIGTILDDDTAPRIYIDSVRVSEGEVARFTLRLQRESGLPVVLSWRTLAGSATAVLDYSDTLGNVTIPAGDLASKIPVGTLVDSISGEGVETFQVRLSNLQGATVGDTIGLASILDKTPLPLVSIDSIGPFVEADSTVYFTVEISGPSAVDVHLEFHTNPVTANPLERYLDTTGILVIPAGQRSGRIAVKILDDSIREPWPETFQLVLSKADSAILAHPIGLATILDDADLTPLAVGDAGTLLEGGDAVFPVTVRGITKDTVHVFWSTVDGTGKSGVDFAAGSGEIVFRPGTLQASIVVHVLTDSVWEPTESFHVRIDSVVHATLIDPTDSLVHAWILDANGIPTVGFLSPDTTVREDQSDSLEVRIGLSSKASVPVAVVVRLQPSTADNPADYTLRGLAQDTIVFPAGISLVSFKVHVVPDSIDEFDEYARWLLQPLAPIRLGDKADYQLTILDDDSAPSLVFAADTQSVYEDVGAVRVSVRLTRVSGKPISAAFHVAGTATPSVDHDMSIGQKIGFSFLPGTDTASIVFHVLEDRITEPTETVDLVLDSARNATLNAGRTHHIVNILDNDSAPVVSFLARDTAVPENVGNVTLRLVLSNPSVFPVVIAIRARGSATLDSLRRGSDAELDSTAVYRITFPPMDTIGEFTFRVNDDGLVEPTESIDFSLVVVDTTGRSGLGERVEILDNDRLPAVEIVRPLDSAHVGIARQTVSWTVDGIPQPDRDTILVSGWNRIVRSYTDTAGNTGTDSIRVWADLTPPRVNVFKITGPNTHDPSKDTTWWGDRARTRFGRDTIWYWVRDSIQNPDNTWWIKIDTLHVVTNFSGDGSFPTQVRACDSIGNCGVDTGWIDLKQSLPVVNILTPPDGASAVVGVLPVTHEVIDGGKNWNVNSTKSVHLPGGDTVMRCYEDDVGNRGCDTHRLNVEPVHVIGGFYIDTDGDGRVDAMVVDLDSKWVSDSLPSFDFAFNQSVRSGQKPDPEAPFYAGPSRGTQVVVGKDTLWVSAGVYLRDSTGKILTGTDGRPLTNVLGDTARDADGKVLRDSLGRILYQVPGPGKIDSTRLLVLIDPPFAFGMTGFDELQDARMVTIWSTRDGSGEVVDGRFVDVFKVDEKVPPVVTKAEIHRVEDYTHPDTLFVTPSEPLLLGSGRDWLQVGRCPTGTPSCQDDQLIWTDVPDSAVNILPDGRYWFLVPPESLTIRPDYRVRFRSDVADQKGNAIDNANLHWSTVISGPPRPERVVVSPPSRIPEIPASEMDRTLPGGILIKATNGNRSGTVDKLEWWEPNRGYASGNDESIRDVCPVEAYCNGPKIDINRPAKIIIYVYDMGSVFVISRTIDITQQDIDKMNPDQLDRLSIELEWNHRNSDGQLVASGVYLWRIVSYLKVKGRNLPVMTNQVYKVGVKVRSRNGMF